MAISKAAKAKKVVKDFSVADKKADAKLLRKVVNKDVKKK